MSRCSVRSPSANFSQTWPTRCTAGVALDVLDDRVDQEPLLVDGQQRRQRCLDRGHRRLLAGRVVRGPRPTAARIVATSAGAVEAARVGRAARPGRSACRPASPQTSDPAAGWSIVPTAHPSPASSWVESPELGPTSRAYSWETTSRQTGYCSTRCTDRVPSGSAHTGIQ